MYLTFIKVNFEFTEGGGEGVHNAGPSTKKCPHFGPMQYLIHCTRAHMNELKRHLTMTQMHK